MCMLSHAGRFSYTVSRARIPTGILARMSASLPAPDLTAAAEVIELARGVVGTGVRHLAAQGGPDVHQVLAYDLAHASAQVETARALLDYGAKGDVEARITCAFTADMVHDLITRLAGREAAWGVTPGPLGAAHPFLEQYRTPEFVASLAQTPGPRHLPDDMEMVADAFRSFADKVIKPQAEHVHRHNADVPEEIVTGLAEMGAFGLVCPRSTAATARAATTSTSAWSSPPRS